MGQTFEVDLLYTRTIPDDHMSLSATVRSRFWASIQGMGTRARLRRAPSSVGVRRGAALATTDIGAAALLVERLAQLFDVFMRTHGRN